MSDPFPDEIDDVIWDEACRRADAIRSFLKQNPAGATAADVAELAAALGLSQATAYRLIKLFRAAGPSCLWSTVDAGDHRGTEYWTTSEKRSSSPRSKHIT
jgi:putative transposase